jgi:hypothetical protein
MSHPRIVIKTKAEIEAQEQRRLANNRKSRNRWRAKRRRNRVAKAIRGDLRGSE